MTSEQRSPSSPAALVICLCAEWCGVCRDYRARFEAVQAKFPQAQFLWIDVEDDADLLHPLDIEDFPTVLVALGNEPRFLGTVTPQAQTLERLLRAQWQPEAAAQATAPFLPELLARIRAAKGGAA